MIIPGSYRSITPAASEYWDIHSCAPFLKVTNFEPTKCTMERLDINSANIARASNIRGPEDTSILGYRPVVFVDH